MLYTVDNKSLLVTTAPSLKERGMRFIPIFEDCLGEDFPIVMSKEIDEVPVPRSLAFGCHEFVAPSLPLRRT